MVSLCVDMSVSTKKIRKQPIKVEGHPANFFIVYWRGVPFYRCE